MANELKVKSILYIAPSSPKKLEVNESPSRPGLRSGSQAQGGTEEPPTEEEITEQDEVTNIPSASSGTAPTPSPSKLPAKPKDQFADPTADVAFKKLFSTDNAHSKAVLMNFLNNALHFKGEEQIVKIQINNPYLATQINDSNQPQGIQGAVDVLCTNKGKQKIAIEMQGQKTSYLLAREQEYMSKLIAGQVNAGEAHEYDKKILDTYIIVIAKDNIFVGKTALTGGVINHPDKKAHSLYETDWQIRCEQTGEEMPGNKMHWKFLELKKFQHSTEYANMNSNSKILDQWLEFFLHCATQRAKPEDRHESIKQAYDIMTIQDWDAGEQALYWKQKQNMITEDQIRQSAFEEGKLEGEIKGAIIKEIETLQKAIDGGQLDAALPMKNIFFSKISRLCPFDCVNSHKL